MADAVTFGRQFYTLADYAGPQCPGLIGDFVYLGRGLEISTGKHVQGCLHARAKLQTNTSYRGNIEPSFRVSSHIFCCSFLAENHFKCLLFVVLALLTRLDKEV